MEPAVGCCNSGSRNCCWSRSEPECNELVNVALSVSGSKACIWRLLWRKMIKKERNKKKIYGFPNSTTTQFSYDPYEYAQNFDQGLMLNDSDDLARSFSARFAVPSRVFLNKGVTV